MSAWRFPVFNAAGLIVAMTGLCGWPAAAQQFQVVNRTLVSSARVTRTQFDYTYRVDVRNSGGAAIGLKATVVSSSPDTLIVESELDFGDVAAGQTVSSIDTFTLRQNREVLFDPAVLTFQFRTGGPPPANQAPVANAGGDQLVAPGQTAQLDGSASFDPDGSIVAYLWTYVGSTPPGLPASLSDASAARPTVLIAAAGVYVFQLVVRDNGGLTSLPSRVTVRTGPVANAGPDQIVRTGDTVRLDGSASFDPEGRALIFAWTLSAPAGSGARLSDPASATPTFVADVAGTYRATLTVNNGVASSPADQVDIVAMQGGLICGDLVSGTLTHAAQTDQYTFAGQAGRIITLTLANTSGFGLGLTSVATLLSPSGDVVVSFGANDQRQVTLSAAGIYTIQVRANNFAATGSYNLGLECRNPAAAVNAALACGSLPSGNLAAAAQVDQYTFEGQPNRIVTLTLANTGGFGLGLTSVATLFAPSGEAIVSFGANDQRQVTLTAAGTYVVQVRANNFAATGTYNFGLECRSPAAEVNAALACGSLASGNLAAAAQVDQYTFEGQPNRIVTLTLANTGGFGLGLTSVATLFGPSGDAVVSFAANDQRQVTLTAAGTYVVQVRANNFAATGTYNLGLECRNAVAEVNAALSCGSLAPGSLAAAAQVDQYTFEGQPNRIVTLTLANTSGFGLGLTSVATLFAPTGEVVASFGANDQRQVMLSAAGTYVIQVRANNFAATGGYNLDLECRIPAAGVNAALACGALAPGNLAAAAQVDEYTFEGQPNRIVTLTLANTGGFGLGLTSVATLFAPTGEAIVSFGANDQRQVPLTAAGTYVIQVRANNFAATGTYNFGLECRNAAAEVNAALACGALAPGNLTAAAQVDQYTFDGQPNRILTLTLANTGGFGLGLTSVATLFAPSGDEVVSFGANDQRQVTLSAAGTYVIQVRANNFAAAGAYSLGLECRNAAAAVNAALACGSLAPGSLAAAQVDQYTFEGQPNRIVTLTLANTGGFGLGLTSVATLFAPSGDAVVSFGANDQRQVTLSAAGTYVVQVRANNFAATGAYNLGLECRNPAAEVNAALACGSLTAGSLMAAAQVDQYTVEGQPNRLVTLTVANTGGFGLGLTSVATLFAPAGDAVVSFGANDQRQVTLSAAGAYVVQVRANNFAAAGGYSIGLQCP